MGSFVLVQLITSVLFFNFKKVCFLNFSLTLGIRRLQLTLLKIALIVGVEVHFNVSFEDVIEPTGNIGWRVKLSPANHPLVKQEFHVVVGADGRRSTLPGFSHKSSKGNQLGIAITVNFVNNFTREDADVEERAGINFIYDQKFFSDLKKTAGINLENIVYYKDDTHYFVMTAKKQSLIERGVVKEVIFNYKTFPL